MLHKVLRSNFFIRLRSWEYWPFGIVQFPFFIYWLFLSLKHRSLVFFSASNPGIPMGGMFGESKYEVLSKVPSEFKPITILIDRESKTEDVLEQLDQAGLYFPLIFKPDIGERGFMVRRIEDEEDIRLYLSAVNCDFLAQELVSLPMEFGVFYTRFPNDQSGKVTSIVGKEMLAVVGDGESTLQQLILASDRAKLQWEKLRVKFSRDLERILPTGEKLELVSTGNHALGTKFLDCNHLIDEQLSESFDRISKQIDGFFFGRFDLRCASLDDLKAGKVKIVELNGCGAEPAHVYQPGYSLWRALGVFYHHWRNIDKISTQNRRLGHRYISMNDARRYYRAFKKATT